MVTLSLCQYFRKKDVTMKCFMLNALRFMVIFSVILVTKTFVTHAMADELSSSICFSREELRFTILNEYDFVSMVPYDFIGEVGKPNLPARNVYIAVPSEARVIEVRVTSSQEEDLPGYYNIYPAQPCVPTSMSADIEFVPPDSLVYNSSTPYPGKLLVYTGTGCLGGQKLVSIRVYPIQYIPNEKRIRFYTRIEFTIHYDLNGTAPLPVNKGSEKAQYLYKQMLSKIVLNPHDIQALQCRPSDSTFEYLVITDDEYVPMFKELTDWKTRKGIPAQIRTVSWITANYAGWDDAEKLRNYLKEAYTDSGLVWVLLGGDTDKVPYRNAFISAEGETDNAPCDLYFSDLDGTWDANGNHIYGELADAIDMYPDVFVGRAPVNTTDEAQTFVNKVLTYERNPPLEDYPLRMLFMAYDADLYTHCEVCKNIIDNLYVPPRFDPITKLYESNGGWGVGNAINALNDGYNIVNHSDHSDWNWMGVGCFNHGARLYSSDMDALTNDNKQSILYSVGCWPAAFEYDAISEHFVNNPNGGGVAFIGNSRYGWYQIGNPGNGPSDLYDKMFFQSLFCENAYQIGFTNAYAKLYYIGSSQSYNCMRWCQFVLNVLGPTEMPIWTDMPDTLNVDYLSLIPPDPDEFIVTVTTEGAPVDSALVCVMDSTVYEYGHTNADGQVVLFISPAIPQDTIWVTVTHHNYLPYEGYTLVLPQGPYVTYLSHSINDTTYGNGDGVVNPGESIEMPLWIKNWGNTEADSVLGVLTTTDPHINDISDSVKSFGQIEPCDTAFTGCDGYDFTILSNCPNAHWITFNLTCTDSQDSTWISYPGVMVAAPVLSYIGYSINDSADGNGNGMPEPGETVDMTVSLANSGLAAAENVHAFLSTDDQFITINMDSASFGNIEPSDTATSTSYNIYIDLLCPDPHYPIFALEIICSNYTTMESFSMTIYIPSFFDDMENLDPGWTHYAVTPGYHDEWHISETRSYSSTHSWKCGNTGSGNYMNYDDAGLITPPIILAPNSCLRFWHWIDAEAYPMGAWDGAIVEISSDDGNTWQQITPVGGYPNITYPGSGSPFPDNTPCFSGSHDWQQEEFYLSEYSGSAHFRFRFGSDGYVTYEGWYIDDVSISSMPIGVEEVMQHGGAFSLLQNYPNPALGITSISYQLPKKSRVSLKLYDVRGRFIKTLVEGTGEPGFHSVTWNTCDNNGKKLASGIYFYRLKAGSYVETKKLLLLR